MHIMYFSISNNLKNLKRLVWSYFCFKMFKKKVIFSGEKYKDEEKIKKKQKEYIFG